MAYYYIILICLGVLAVLYIACGLALSIYLFCMGKRTNDDVIKHELQDKDFDITLLDIPYEDFYTYSRFGYKLHGRFYAAEQSTNKLVIDLHGKHSCCLSQLRYLSTFRDLGFNVFFPDHRGCGLSGGGFISYGAYEKYDVMNWIRVLKKRMPGMEIVLFGESMGAATALLTAPMESSVKAVVSYCAYASLGQIMRDYAGVKFPKWLKVFFPATYLAAGLFFGIPIYKCDPLSAIKKIEVPVLLMHSHADEVIDVSQARMLAEACPNAETVFFKDSPHAQSFIKYPEVFRAAVQDFLKRKVD